jgi:type VI secretion system protein ImpA
MAFDLSWIGESVSDEAPCGPNLEDDPRHRACLKALDEALGKDAQALSDAPDQAASDAFRDSPVEAPLADAVANALAVLQESRDLWIAAAGAQMSILSGKTDGAADFAEALAVLVETRWETVWPALDPEMGTPAMARTNACAELGSFARFARYIERQPIVALKSAGRLTWRMVVGRAPETAKGADILTGIQGPLRKAIDTSPQAAWEDILSAWTRLSGSIARIGDAFTANNAEAPSFDRVQNILARHIGFVRAILDLRRPPEPAAAPDGAEEGEGGSPVMRGGSLNVRADALARLEDVRAFFAAAEPSSPIPLMIERIQRVAGMSFLEIVENLGPTGSAEVRSIVLGPQPEPPPEE